MKRASLILGILAGCLSIHGSHAAELRNAGILGNSGEQGATLVRFSDKPAMGMGAVADAQGTIWDRGGDGVLNRYAADGRLLGTWPIPLARMSRDGIVLIGDTLLFKSDRKLCTLPIDAAPGTAPRVLPVEVTHLATRAHDGWAAAAKDKEVFLVNLAGETRPVATVNELMFAVETGPDGGVYAHVVIDKKSDRIVRLDSAAPANERGPWPYPGSRLQWLTGHWWGSAYHGTIRRFSPDFRPAPGVVLGGASGSFIGYVPENSELEECQGLAHLGGKLYAASGRTSVLHLLEWDQADQRFEIVRRIGAVPRSGALALDSEGGVWFYGGVWQWSDGPDAPLQHGVPPPNAPGAFAAIMTPEDELIAAGTLHGAATLWTGALDGPTRRSSVADALPKDAVAAALAQWDKKRVLLAVNGSGSGVAMGLDLGSKSGRSVAGKVDLRAKSPMQSLTTLSSAPQNALLAAADGYLIEFAAGPENTWSETRRWNQWGDGKDQFGGTIHAAFSEGRIWVSDAEKHRVLCFDVSSGQPVLAASFGTTGTAGDDMAKLNRPATIAANGTRAVVFDSGNQRIVRLELR